MPIADKIVGENKGKEEKSPGLDLGYKRNSNHEYGDKRDRTRRRMHGKKENTVTKRIKTGSWKWKKREKGKESDVKQNRELRK